MTNILKMISNFRRIRVGHFGQVANISHFLTDNQKRSYHKHLEYHEHFGNHIVDAMRCDYMLEDPEMLIDYVNYCTGVGLLHKQAAEMFQSLDENKVVDPSPELINFIRETRIKEECTTHELYHKFDNWCKKE